MYSRQSGRGPFGGRGPRACPPARPSPPRPWRSVTDRREAPAAEGTLERALGRDRRAGRPIVARTGASRRRRPALDGQRELRGCRQALPGSRVTAFSGRPSGPIPPTDGSAYRRRRPARRPPPRTARRRPPCATCRSGRTRSSWSLRRALDVPTVARDGSDRSRCPSPGDEHVPPILAARIRTDRQPIDRVSRQVLGRVHRRDRTTRPRRPRGSRRRTVRWSRTPPPPGRGAGRRLEDLVGRARGHRPRRDQHERTQSAALLRPVTASICLDVANRTIWLRSPGPKLRLPDSGRPLTCGLRGAKGVWSYGESNP